jgi:hypothetical protein
VAVGVSVGSGVAVDVGLGVSVGTLVGSAACVSAIAVEMLAGDGAHAASANANNATPQNLIPLPPSPA